MNEEKITVATGFFKGLKKDNRIGWLFEKNSLISVGDSIRDSKTGPDTITMAVIEADVIPGESEDACINRLKRHKAYMGVDERALRAEEYAGFSKADPCPKCGSVETAQCFGGVCIDCGHRF